MKRPVLVTTKENVIMFGLTEDSTGDSVMLEQARLCVYWAADLKGWQGLAVYGPNQACRIGPEASKCEVRNVTTVTEVSKEAVRRFDEAPWST